MATMGQSKRGALQQLDQFKERIVENVRFAGAEPVEEQETVSPTDAPFGEAPDPKNPLGAAAGSVQQLPLDRIIVRPGFNVRAEVVEDDELEALAQGMADVGLIQPIVVIPYDETQYAVVAGHRRLMAARFLRWSVIPAIVQTWDDRTQRVANYIENRHRATVSPFDEAKRAVELMEAHGWSLRETAIRLHESLGRLSALVRIYRNPRLRLALESEQLPLRWLNRFIVLVDHEGREKLAGSLDVYLAWITKERPTWDHFLEALEQTQVHGLLPRMPSRAAPAPTPAFERVWASTQRLHHLAERYQAKLSTEELLTMAHTLIAQGESLAEVARRRSAPTTET